uniref:Uncharacterized protein n=1 Tax=Romanomermis culicivorax TaxID=13658 RepID=A0A915JP29_ROMCU
LLKCKNLKIAGKKLRAGKKFFCSVRPPRKKFLATALMLGIWLAKFPSQAQAEKNFLCHWHKFFGPLCQLTQISVHKKNAGMNKCERDRFAFENDDLHKSNETPTICLQDKFSVPRKKSRKISTVDI